MIPLAYVDFCLKAERGASMTEVAIAASALMRALHAVFKQMPELFALAVPDLDSKSPQRKLSTFRVFAERMEDLHKLHEALKAGSGLNRLFEARFPETVPTDFSGPWKAFVRVRIHSRSVSECRAKTMRTLDEKGTSWIDMASSENGHRFRMYLASVPGSSVPEGGTTNSYGLSNANNPLYLPHIGR